MTWSAFLTHFLFATGLVGVAASITWWMLHRVRVIDYPNARSSHTSPVPKSGGIAIVATFLIGVLGVYILGDKTQIAQRYFLGFIFSSLAIAAVSFYDDIRDKPFTIKLATQMLAAIIVMYFGLVVDQLGSVQYGWLGYVITFVWIIGLTNAYNFMDGLDGLAAGVAVITAAFLTVITFIEGSLFAYINSYAVLAGALGFLFFNFPPARIFMGDVGSAFLGFVFATLAIIAAQYDHSHTSFLVMPLLLLNFIYDTAFTFFRRLIAGEHVTQAHRTHLYQLCNRLGWSHRQVCLFYYGLCLLQGFAAIWMLYLPGGDKRILVFVPFLLFYGICTWIVISMSKSRGIL